MSRRRGAVSHAATLPHKSTNQLLFAPWDKEEGLWAAGGFVIDGLLRSSCFRSFRFFFFFRCLTWTTQPPALEVVVAADGCDAAVIIAATFSLEAVGVM